MTTRLRRHWAFTLMCGLALIAVAATYGNHFRNAFHFDDFHTIANNAFIRDIRNIPRFFSDTKTVSALPANQAYRPLLMTTLAIDYRLGGGLHPIAFHATSFALFLVQCVAMLFLYRRVMDRAQPQASNRWISLFAAAWYALHTANAETVNYIIARSEILSTLGAVLAVLLYARGGRSRTWKLYVIPAAASVFAKEHGAMTALLVFFYAALFDHDLSVRELLRPRRLVKVFAETWPVFLVCGLVLAAGVRLATSFMAGGGGISRWHYLLAQPFVIVHYVLTFFLPLNLSADTDWKPIANPFDDRVIVGVIFILAALWLIVVASRRRETRPITYGLLWFFAALLPTSSVIPLAEVTNDHRLYFPFVGLTLAVVWALALAIVAWQPLRIRRRRARAIVMAAAALLLIAHAYGTRQRNAIWRTEESLWFDVTQKSPENGRGLMNYGVIQVGKGNYDAAQYYFDRALQLVPRYADLHVNLGVLQSARGQTAEAERHFQQAMVYDPATPVSYTYYARWLDSVGRSEEAAVLLRRAVELSPADVGTRSLLSTVLARRHEWAALESLSRETLRIEPSDPVAKQWLTRAAAGDTAGPAASADETPEHWLALSLVQYRAGRYEDCVESSRRALRLRSDYAEAYNNICAAQNALGRYADAVEACERALAITPAFPLARNNLAAARARLSK